MADDATDPRNPRLVRYAVAYIRDNWGSADKVEQSDMLDLLDQLVLKEAIGPVEHLWLGEKFDAKRLADAIRSSLEN